ncbi:MAG: type ISP restriction/modification enzyme, partial [Actinomycetota bacterium]
VRLCQNLLVERFDLLDGFGDPEVVVLDPAAGTGTYPLTIAAHTLEAAEMRGGEGVKAEVATQLVRNLHAFELLVGPYAVSHLRLSRTFADAGAQMTDDGVNVFLTDTLATPQHQGFAKQASLFQQRLAREQERASKVKDPATKVTVVIGNPPWDRDEALTKRGVRRKGGMVRYEGTTDKPGLIKDFIEPLRTSGMAGHAKNLYNDYVYFWRWAIWKICEQTSDRGIVSFITAASYLNGPGFAGMREMMRRHFDELWILDLGGEGRGARQEENVFDGVLTPAVITFGIRLPDKNQAVRLDTPAVTRYHRIDGTRIEKFAALSKLTELKASGEWQQLSSEWGALFSPASGGDFGTWLHLDDVFPWHHSGAQFKRSWPIAESKDVLERRWTALLAGGAKRAALLKESRDRHADKSYKDLITGEPLAPLATLPDDTPTPSIRRYDFRSFDRQWCIAYNRVGDFLRPQLWGTSSNEQVFFTTLTTSPLSNGPAITVTANVPDLHHFRGSFGAKDVMPLWRTASADDPNITHGLLDTLTATLGKDVTAKDVAAYVMGVLGTSAYTTRFAGELTNSGPRIPFTADVELFDQIVALGSDLLWWGTYGERFRPTDDNSKPVRRLPVGTARNNTPVSAASDKYPETFAYDEAAQTVTVGDGTFAPVTPEMWTFEVSGLKVIQSFLQYRMKKRAGKKSSELDEVRPTTWTFSTELVELLAVVEHFVAASARAAELLDELVAGDIIGADKFATPTADEQEAPTDVRAPVEAVPTLFD